MSLVRAVFLVGVALGLLMFSPASPAQSFNPVGGLDCNGFSNIQRPLRPRDICTDFRLEYGRGYDNGHYIGHDEPSIGFISTVPHSGNNVQWEFTLPRERPLPATQSFENFPTFWLAMALCDPGSFPNGTCIPDSDENTPSLAGSAFLEMQFYPPGNPPFITQISCDLKHWCASLHINSLEVMSNGFLNPNCAETTNFAFIQRDGIPTGPPGPNNLNFFSVTPNAQTLLMNQGDRLRITIKDVPGNVSGGVLTLIEDLSTGQSGFMIASAHNGYQTTDPNTCAGTDFSFHPEFDTAKFGNFVPWAVLQANVNFAMEIGHFETADGDSDDAGCFPGPTVAGCLGATLISTARRTCSTGQTARGTTPLRLQSILSKEAASAPSVCLPIPASMTSPFQSFTFRPLSQTRSPLANRMGSAASSRRWAHSSIPSMRWLGTERTTRATINKAVCCSSAISAGTTSIILVAMRSMVHLICPGSLAKTAAAPGAIRASRILIRARMMNIDASLT